MRSLVSICLIALLPLALGFSLNAPLPPARAISARHASLPMMNEAEKPKEAAVDAAAPAPVAPDLGVPAVPKDEGFDITKYSMTLSIGVLVIFTKALSYFGIVDLSD